ncbi:hypothetical protein [Vibrio cincinnatiensis]|uniref:hypothetical protein n=1 Tax=Vibrio cincinnatiensis TaxID=675 RepID=UPI0038AC2F13
MKTITLMSRIYDLEVELEKLKDVAAKMQKNLDLGYERQVFLVQYIERIRPFDSNDKITQELKAISMDSKGMY